MSNVERLKTIFKSTQTIAIVGLSDNPDRPSYGVADYLSRHFEMIGINPNIRVWQGMIVYPSLMAVPAHMRIDLVDVFRRSEEVQEVVKDIIARNAVTSPENQIKTLWLQLGVKNHKASETAKAAGIEVIEDSCIAVEHAKVRG